jgi:hypothetical protein
MNLLNILANLEKNYDALKSGVKDGDQNRKQQVVLASPLAVRFSTLRVIT